MSVPSWELGPPPPSPQSNVSPPLLGPKGREEQHSLAGEKAWGEANSVDWKESLAL